MGEFGQTPSQTVGPYFSMRLATRDDEAVMAGEDTPGQLIELVGQVLDGDGHHVEDALLEVWQADADGRYRHPFDDVRPFAADCPGFTGFGRARSTPGDGTWSVRTIKPGRVPHPDGSLQAPHLNLCIQGRGMLMPAFTRVYFADEQAANKQDAVLAAVPEDRRHTLVATPNNDAEGVPTYRFDIRMQGDDETVFLDF